MTVAALPQPEVRGFQVLPHQHEALTAPERHVLLAGGVGAGKTTCGAAWNVKKMLEIEPGGWPQDYAQGIICANTYDQLYDSTLRNYFAQWRGMGLSWTPNDVPRSRGGLSIAFDLNGDRRILLARALNHYDSLAGTEVGFAIVDEAWGTEMAAMNVLNARIRHPTQGHRQTLYTSTLDDKASWMYDFFVEKADHRKRVIYAPTTANPFLPGDYITDLEDSMSDAEYRRMVLSEWVTLIEGRVYYAFGDWNVSHEAEFNPERPFVAWSHDFNISAGNPISSVLAHIVMAKGPTGKKRAELHVFDEIVIEGASTGETVDELEERDWFKDGKMKPAKVLVTGDASGKNRDTRSKKSDYDVLSQRGYRRQQVPGRNPPLREQHNTVNAALKAKSGDVRVKIHPRCRTLIRGLETVSLKKGAHYLEEETREQHVAKAFTYLVMSLLPKRAVVRGKATVKRS